MEKYMKACMFSCFCVKHACFHVNVLFLFNYYFYQVYLSFQMFFINRGMVEVVSEDGTVVFATMNEGKFFGEISLVFSCPRTASIRCTCVSMYHCVEVGICMY